MTDAEHQREPVSLFMQQSAVHLLDWTPVKDKSGNWDRFFFPNGCILMGETFQHVWSEGWEDPLEKEMQPTQVFLPGESRGQRSLGGYSPRGRRVGHDRALAGAMLELSLSGGFN